MTSGACETNKETTSAVKAPVVTNSAWAKLGRRITRMVSVMPRAINAYRLPT